MIDYSTVGSDEVPVITSMWDMESAANEWTETNRFFYAFKLYGRRIENKPFDPVTFCEGKDTGSYVNDNWETIDCENDSWDGGWTKIFTYHGEQQYGDKGIIYG